MAPITPVFRSNWRRTTSGVSAASRNRSVLSGAILLVIA
jgi:hypothetical protein